MASFSLDHLETFLRVAELGSFTAAARELRRAQSAVSYAVASLEASLGVALFDRTGRRPMLTPAGRELVAEARELRGSVDRIAARARAFAEGVEPEVSLAVDVAYPVPGLLGVLAAFEREFPMVTLRLHTEAMGAVHRLVLDGESQLGVGIHLPTVAAELTAIPLGSVAMERAVAPTHALAALRPPVALAEAQRHRQIVQTDRSTLTAGQEFGVIAGRVWRVADLSMKVALIRAGFGWGSLPVDHLAPELQAGTLTRLIVAGSAPTLVVPLLAFHLPRRPPGRAGRWLLERLRLSCLE